MSGRTVDHKSERALHKQLADILREDIRSGAIPPGRQLPGEHRLGQIHEVGRETVRKALAILRAEGLTYTDPGHGTFVREPREYTVIKLKPGERIITRMPTPEERDEFDLPEGVPVLVVSGAGGERVLPGDTTMLEA